MVQKTTQLSSHYVIVENMTNRSKVHIRSDRYDISGITKGMMTVKRRYLLNAAFKLHDFRLVIFVSLRI